VFSTILLTIESPLDNPHGNKKFVLIKMDVVVTIIFTWECVIKIIVYGFIFGKDTYMRVGWNVMDFIIVTFSIISLSFSDIELDFIKILRMLRVLRPLRMISRNPGLRIQV